MSATSGNTSTELFSPRQVSEALGISVTDALDLMLTGGIRTVREDGVPMVPAAAVEEYRRQVAG